MGDGRVLKKHCLGRQPWWPPPLLLINYCKCIKAAEYSLRLYKSHTSQWQPRHLVGFLSYPCLCRCVPCLAQKVRWVLDLSALISECYVWPMTPSFWNSDYSGTWMWPFSDFAIMHPVPHSALGLAGLPVCCKNQCCPPRLPPLLLLWETTPSSSMASVLYHQASLNWTSTLTTLQTSVSCCCNRMPEARHFETKDVTLWRLPDSNGLTLTRWSGPWLCHMMGDSIMVVAPVWGRDHKEEKGSPGQEGPDLLFPNNSHLGTKSITPFWGWWLNHLALNSTS